jgi:predicted ribosomally synthesized peptide with SipW-like signal peptide
MRKKLSFFVLAAAVVLTGIAVTRTFFQDTETSSGNKFVAGKFNLQVGSQCTYNGDVITDCNWLAPKDLSGELFFNFNDVKPGDYGENTIKLHVDNNDAWMCARATNLVSDDNGCDKPESDIDTTCGPGQGELKQNLLFTVWKDTNCNNLLDPAHCAGQPDDPDHFSACSNYDVGYCTEIEGCYVAPPEQVLVSDQPASAGVWPIADATTLTGPIKGGTDYCLGVSWKVPIETSNIIQSDSLEGDVIFNAVQSRNLPGLRCSDLASGGPICVPTAEICDGLDNNCNNLIDDNCTSTSDPGCGVGYTLAYTDTEYSVQGSSYWWHGDAPFGQIINKVVIKSDGIYYPLTGSQTHPCFGQLEIPDLNWNGNVYQPASNITGSCKIIQQVEFCSQPGQF